MLSNELQKYLLDNKVEPVYIDIQSTSHGKATVPCFYMKHPVSGQEYKDLSAVISGKWVSCVLDVSTLLLVPKEHLGPSISILDAVQAATNHRLGKTTARAITIVGPSLAELKAEITIERESKKVESETAVRTSMKEVDDVVKKKSTKKKATKKKASPQ